MNAHVPETKLFNVEAEQALLGAILVNNQAFWMIGDLQDSDFYDPIHRRIFKTIKEQMDLGRTISPITLKSFLEPDAKVGGLTVAQYLARMASEAVTVIGAPDYARTIRDLGKLRRLDEALSLARDTIRKHSGGDISGILADVQAQVYAADLAGDRDMKPIGEWAMDQVGFLGEILRQGEDAYVGFSSGLRAVDEVTGPFMPGKLYVIGALSSVGKSALTQQIAERFARQAMQQGKGWGYIGSLEMTGGEYAIRSLARELGITASRIEQASINTAEYEQLFDKAREMRDLPIVIDQRPRMTFETIRSRMIQLKHQKGLAFGVIDHILLIRSEGKRDSLMDRVAEATIEAKNLAKELGIPIFMLSQLKDTVYERPGGRPAVPDLFGGRSIEQNADVIIFIHRQEIIHKMNEPDTSNMEKHAAWAAKLHAVAGKAQIIGGKRRGGTRGEIRDCLFDGPTMRFSDV